MFASSDNAVATRCPVLTINYSIATGIKTTNVPAVFSLYPNPVENELNLLCNLDMSYLSISDVTGKVRREEKVESRSCTISNLQPGVYLIGVQR